MKAAAEKQTRVRGDFYTSTIAPINNHRDLHFRALDVLALTVLFLEVGVLIRWLLAK
jgi:hypothetical protein